MSYYDRAQRPISGGRYSHPYDHMVDSFNRFHEAFYQLSDAMMPLYGDRRLDRPFLERQMLERHPYNCACTNRSYYDKPCNEKLAPENLKEKGYEKLQEKETEKGKLQEKFVPEKCDQVTPNIQEKSTATRQSHHPLILGLLERPIMDVLGTFEDPFFKSNWESNSTFDRAHKIFDELLAKGKPNINLSKGDELLKIPEEFEEVYREFEGKTGGQVSGTTYQTSNITKDGKTVTVVRQTKLLPDGTISTKVSQHFDDGTGQRDTKTRKKKINFKTGVITDDIQDIPMKKVKVNSSETEKLIECTKKDENAKDGQIQKEQEPMQQETTEKQ